MSIKNKFLIYSSMLLIITTTSFAQTEENPEMTQCIPQVEVDKMTDEQIENLELPMCIEEFIGDDEIINEDPIIDEQTMFEGQSIQ